ncbi:(4Fe-4S)-binding protein [Streptomyces afghaniensis]|uniref:(4Fe-4S)-binding protein n=1 Tax=Streptomyces afghaniensis TaxID=66865 RepID=UPI0033A130DB
MNSTSQKRAYKAPKITAAFEARRLLHAAGCVNGLPEAPNLSRRPWILPDDAPANVMRRCPSGRCSANWSEGEVENPDRPNGWSFRWESGPVRSSLSQRPDRGLARPGC